MRVELALVALLTVAACSDGAEAEDPDEFTARGTLTMPNTTGAIDWEMYGETGETCWGGIDYVDIAEGAEVIIRNGKGDSVGLGTLEAGTLTKSARGRTCAWEFTVEDIPDEGELFTIEIGRRGEVTFKRDDADNIQVSLRGY
jgi:hypothetical protein